MILYKICVKCEAYVDACYEICPFCDGTLVSVTDDEKTTPRH